MSFPERTGRDVHHVRSDEPRVSSKVPTTIQGNLHGRTVEVRQVPGQGSDSPVRAVAKELQEHGYSVKSGAGAVVVTAQVDTNRVGVPLSKQMVQPSGHQQVGTRKPH